jgi:hypothetical protein
MSKGVKSLRDNGFIKKIIDDINFSILYESFIH